MSSLPESVNVTVESYEPDYVCVSYIAATLDELHSAGVINHEALQVFNSTKRRIYKHPQRSNGHCARHRLYRPDRWQLVWYTNPESAVSMKLPGMDSSPEELRAAARRQRSLVDLEPPPMRAVGRFQRLVQWSSSGNVILVNWQRIAAEAYVQSSTA